MTGAFLVAIVDDDAALRRSVGNLLGSAGIEARAFSSAEELLASGVLAETRCLVVDARLEGMSGLELLAHLHGIGRTLPVIMLSARGEPELRRQARERGAAVFLTKPFRPAELVDAVKKAMAST